MLYRRPFSRYCLADTLHDASKKINSSIMAGPGGDSFAMMVGARWCEDTFIMWRTIFLGGERNGWQRGI